MGNAETLRAITDYEKKEAVQETEGKEVEQPEELEVTATKSRGMKL